MPPKDKREREEYQRQFRTKRLSSGLCPHCGDVIDTEILKCSKCRGYQREYAKQHNAKKRVEGKCQSCGKVKVEKGKCPHCENLRLLWQDKNRNLVFDHYGRTCICCGESEFRFLTIDHINNDGATHRKAIGGNLYSWLIKNQFPDGFQVLCFNCNHGKHLNGGICPHQVAR